MEIPIFDTKEKDSALSRGILQQGRRGAVNRKKM
jgi:hypothetical protein